MNVVVALRRKRRTAVEGFTETVENTPEAGRRHGHTQRVARIEDRHAPREAGRVMKRNRTHVARIEMLVNLEEEGFAVALSAQGPVKRWQDVAFDHHDRTVNFRDEAYRGVTAGTVVCRHHLPFAGNTAIAPARPATETPMLLQPRSPKRFPQAS